MQQQPIRSGKMGILIAMIFVIGIFTCLGIGKSLVWGLSFTLILAVGLLKTIGVSFKESFHWLGEGIYSIKDIYIVVLLIGVNVAMWTASGIVPSLIYYGFGIVEHINFLLFAYLLTGVVAFFLGTGLGTLSTAGIAVLTLGVSVGLPKGILMGAILSGAYIADRLSPISALVNFTLETTEVTFRKYFKETGWSMLPAMILTGVIFYLFSLKFPAQISIDEMTQLKFQLKETFVISPLLFIIPLVILWTSFKGMKTKSVLSIGIGLSAVVILFIQQNSVMELLDFMLNGFESGSPYAFIQSLEIGGAMAMFEVVIIIMAGISMSTIYEKCGWLDPLIAWVAGKSNSPRQLVLNTSVLSIGLNALTCDQTVGILIPGKYLKSTFKKHGYDHTTLSQVIANSGTAIAPLMPWNVNAIIILAITGVSALEFAPFAVLCWLSLPFCLWLTHPKKAQ